MGLLKRYGLRLRVGDGSAILDAWQENAEAAVVDLQDQALGVAARLQQWAADPGTIYQTAAGAEPTTDWPSDAAAREWHQREQALLPERGGLQCVGCHEWSPPTANYCGACGESLRFWCIACHERLPHKKHGGVR